MGKMIRVISEDGAVLGCALDSTDMVDRAEKIHVTSAVVTAAMGRLLTAASMMGAQMKNDGDAITLRIAGGGPSGPVVAVADAEGNARVTVENPVVELPLNADGKLDVAGAVGIDGFLSVIRDSGSGEPQTGFTPIVSGEIGEDITHYYAVSEQIPTACGLGVLVNPDLSVRAAGGLLVQLLPGADDNAASRIEQNLARMQPVSGMIRDGLSPLGVLEQALEGFELQIIEEKEVEYRCDCSRERAERVLRSLGGDELARLAAERELTSVECHFCDRQYDFSAQDLLAL